MPQHTDIVVGSADADDGASIKVTVFGVDVRLDIRRPERAPVVVLLAPDDAIHLVSLLERALRTGA